MPSFLVRSRLSRGDLRIYLSNDLGQAQDAFDVRWTVFGFDGSKVSGKDLPAIRAKTGEYYAPWYSDVKNGNYRIEWSVIPESGQLPRKFTEQFFVVDPSSYGPCEPLNPNDIPERGGFTYLSGTFLGRGDLPLFLKSPEGLPADAFAVFWTIYDAVGRSVSPRTIATRAAMGEYFVQWNVCVCSGDYLVTWEWMAFADSPLESKSMRFSVINPINPFTPLVPILCDGFFFDPCSNCPVILAPRLLMDCSTPCDPCACDRPCSAPSAPCGVTIPVVPVVMSNPTCCQFEIPRVIHLVTGPLPPSGNTTSQPPFAIPRGVRHITFYITYTRGAPNGFATFKLFWGNGVEETQETLVDHDILIVNSANSSQDMFLQSLDGPAPLDGNPINFILYVTIPGGTTTVRLIAAEKGVPGAPGTIGITLTASS